MMGRARSKARAGWPDNLYPNRDGFKYRHPITRRETWMGREKAKAFAAAKTLNSLLAPADDLVAKVAGAANTVATAIKVFRDDDLPHRGWSPKTAAWYGVYLTRLETDIGDRPLESLSVKDCANYIRGVTESPRSRQTYRLLLSWILACAVQEGWIDSNPAEATRKFTHTRQRERLTVAAFQAIHATAPAWLQNAMDLSLLTLLRREDVVSLTFADLRDGALYVVPSKTEQSTNVRLTIELDDQLSGLISRCRDDVVSPYMVHRLPEKARPTGMRAKGRVHHTQVMPEQLTRAFADARDAAGLAGASAPTFHEIRSLGGAMLQDAGWTLEQVQKLMGHASEAMTTHYLAGHEAPWTPVSTGITLPDRVGLG